MLLPRPVPGLLVALALASCALASTSSAQSTGSDEQHVVVAQPPGTSLHSALAVRQLTPADLKLRKTTQDGGGRRHHRYRQRFNGLDVIGGDLVVHADAQGSIYAINGAARGNLPASLGQHDIGPSAALTFVQADARFAGMSMSTPRAVYLITPEGATFKTYEIVAEGERAATPVRDKVYVDVDSGTVVGVHPQIHSGLNRSAYSANNGTSLPGSLRRSEGQAATSDVDVNAAYDNTGDTYNAYWNFWNRDSYNNAGAMLRSTVHYSSNYCNAFWNGSQMVYGDGTVAQGCFPLARSVDVTAHELTHAVTENESGLIYSGESGGLNEAMSDIFGAFTQAWVDGGRTGTLAVAADTWTIGEDVLPPALRWMNDPALDRCFARLLDQRGGQCRCPLQLRHRQPRLLSPVAGRPAPARQVDYRGDRHRHGQGDSPVLRTERQLSHSICEFPRGRQRVHDGSHRSRLQPGRTQFSGGCMARSGCRDRWRWQHGGCRSHQQRAGHRTERRVGQREAISRSTFRQDGSSRSDSAAAAGTRTCTCVSALGRRRARTTVVRTSTATTRPAQSTARRQGRTTSCCAGM